MITLGAQQIDSSVVFPADVRQKPLKYPLTNSAFVEPVELFPFRRPGERERLV